MKSSAGHFRAGSISTFENNTATPTAPTQYPRAPLRRLVDFWFWSRTEVTAPAVQEIVKEIGRMGDAPVTEQEMSLAKASLVRSLPLFETTLDTVAMFADIPAYNLGPSYYTEFSKKVDAVTDAEVKSLAKKYLVPGKLLIVAVGDRKVIESGLKGIGKTGVQMRDADGNLLQ